MLLRTGLILSLAIMSKLCGADEILRKNGWPNGSKTVQILSSKDRKLQPAIILSAPEGQRRPLLVALHTWSGGYSQAGGETLYAKWSQERRWHFVHPHFRGPNRSPQSLGSDLAVQDIIDSVDHMKKNFKVDDNRVYLVGVSGGGHAALLMAGRHPDIWAGVSAWCPISDVEEWWNWHAFRDEKYQPKRYAIDIEKAIGGRPDSSVELKKECRSRSPINYLSRAKNVNLDINHGLQDGRKGSVPFLHSIWAFNQIATPSARLDRSQAEAFFKQLQLPQSWKPAAVDKLYGNKQPVFRRIQDQVRLTIFDGNHEIIHLAALNWLAHQQRGHPAVWKLSETHGFLDDENQAFDAGK